MSGEPPYTLSDYEAILRSIKEAENIDPLAMLDMAKMADEVDSLLPPPRKLGFIGKVRHWLAEHLYQLAGRIEPRSSVVSISEPWGTQTVVSSGTYRAAFWGIPEVSDTNTHDVADPEAMDSRN